MTIADRDAETVYLEDRKFDGGRDYSIEITNRGVTVYSECCADTMSLDTAKAVHAALGRYIVEAEGKPCPVHEVVCGCAMYVETKKHIWPCTRDGAACTCKGEGTAG